MIGAAEDYLYFLISAFYRQDDHLQRVEMYRSCIIMLVGKLGEITILTSLRHRWKENVKMGLRRCKFYSYELYLQTEEKTHFRTFLRL
jgi:hypothetical protein